MLINVHMALARLVLATQAQVQQQQQQLDRDRQQLAEDRTAAQHLLLGACLELRKAKAADPEDETKQELCMRL